VRGVGPLRMIRGKVDGTTVAAGLRRGHGVHRGCTEVEGWLVEAVLTRAAVAKDLNESANRPFGKPLGLWEFRNPCPERGGKKGYVPLSRMLASAAVFAALLLIGAPAGWHAGDARSDRDAHGRRELKEAMNEFRQDCAPLPPVKKPRVFDCTAAQIAMSEAKTPPSCMCRFGLPGDKGCLARGDSSDPQSTRWLRDGLMRSQGQEDKYIFRTFFDDARFRVSQRTFVELGAYTGVALSNSYFFEKVLGWRGVLIEANEANFEKLRDKSHRERASKVHAAVCYNSSTVHMGGKGAVAALNMSSAASTLVDTLDLSALPPGHTLCLPMASILNIAGLSTDPTARGVDFFSLDVEGAEEVVLDTHDWARLPVRVLVMEVRRSISDTDFRARVERMHRTLASHGMCRFAKGVGLRNEVWIDPTYETKVNGKTRPPL